MYKKPLTLRSDASASPSAPPEPPAAVSAVIPTKTNSIDSQELFQGQQEIFIEHEGQAYRLRITRQRKLILTK